MTQTTIQKDTRLQTSSGDIMRVLSVEPDENEILIVTICGTKTYKSAQSRGAAKLSVFLSKIEAGDLKIVSTKLGQSEMQLGTGGSNWQPEVIA